MKRREFITKTSAVAAAAAATAGTAATAAAANSPGIQSRQKTEYEWRLVTAWPSRTFAGLGEGALRFAKLVTEMSNYQMTIRVFSGGEVVPASETFNAVSTGVAEMGHGASYYWSNRNPAFTFFTAVPFGLTAQEMNGWIYHNGGQALWDELYAPHNVKPFIAGNTGAQMAGWFNREINSMADLRGLKMRMPGLAGDVLRAAGAEPVMLLGHQIVDAFRREEIEATKWIAPYADYDLGFHNVAKYYYYPGWQEANACGELLVNKAAFNALPADLQWVIETAAQAVNNDILAIYTARNGEFLAKLKREHKVQLKRFPDDVLHELHVLSDKVVADFADSTPDTRKVYESFDAYRKQANEWTEVSESALARARTV